MLGKLFGIKNEGMNGGDYGQWWRKQKRKNCERMKEKLKEVMNKTKKKIWIKEATKKWKKWKERKKERLKRNKHKVNVRRNLYKNWNWNK